MSILQLSYVSEPAPDFTLDDVQAMIVRAQAHNRAHHLSGVLLYRHDRLVQVLEGDPRVVTDLFGRIARDPRHRNVVLVGCVRVAQRRYPDWDMSFLPLREAQRTIILRRAASDRLMPDDFDHDGLVELIDELVAVRAR